MLFVIPDAVPKERLAEVQTALAAGRFVASDDGPSEKARANRLVLEANSHAVERACQQVVGSLQAHAVFQAAALPVAITMPRIYRYEEGMGCRDHVDGAFAGEAPRMRCDIAVTICLSDADSYDGGDLVVAAHGAPARWRGNAGDCVLYPPDELHRVEPVTRGARVVATTWVQSQVRDPRQRRVLFDLANILEDAEGSSVPSSSLERLRRGYFNLLRLWT
jgi:PKHD-type hydroxylase